MPIAKVLIVDDDKEMAGFLAELLKLKDCHVRAVETAKEALALACDFLPNLVLLDLYLPDGSGLEVLEQLVKRVPAAKIVMMTGHGDIETAIRAMKIGAVDFLLKPFEIKKLEATLRVLLNGGGEKESPLLLKSIVGESPQMKETWAQIRRYIIPDVSILLLGESGTGKELFAKAIHARSKRSSEPFVALDCATLPDTLVESEIYGHEKGAFTGASERKMGKFEAAEGGTLLLDEIGNLPLHVQAKLLRVLQERCIERLGGKHPIPVDVRILSATNLDLEQAIHKGTFREDLYYRLAEVAIVLPPLRKREGDIPVLINYFIEEFNRKFDRQVLGISDRAMQILLAYRWPGNVREIENVIRASLLAAEDVISEEHLPQYLFRNPDETPPDAQNGMGRRNRIRQSVDRGIEIGSLDLKSLVAEFADEIEQEIIAEVLNRRSFSQAELSALLKIDPKTLRVKLQKYGLRAR